MLFGLAGLPPAVELHGDMTQAARLDSLERFRKVGVQGGTGSWRYRVMVCTGGVGGEAGRGGGRPAWPFSTTQTVLR
jgi:hypothetical protein